MARGVNKVILLGNLGGDPEVRYMPSGGAVTSISLATSETWKDKQSGENQERTEWHRVAFFNRMAEIAGEYLRKGSRCYIEGSLKTQKWQDKATGQDRYKTEIIASDLQILDSKRGGGAEDDAAKNSNAWATSGRATGHQEMTGAPQFEDDLARSSAKSSNASGVSGRTTGHQEMPGTTQFDDDDIPF